MRLSRCLRSSSRMGGRQEALDGLGREVLDHPAYTHAAYRFAATLAAEAAEHPDATHEAEAVLTLDHP